MKELYKALAQFQEDCPVIKKNSHNPFTKSDYANLTEIKKETKKALKDNGLQIIQVNELDFLVTTLRHIETGQELKSKCKIVGESAQQYGGGITYARRYDRVTILDLDTETDDDGNTANGNKIKETPKQSTETPKYISKELNVHRTPDGSLESTKTQTKKKMFAIFTKQTEGLDFDKKKEILAEMSERVINKKIMIKAYETQINDAEAQKLIDDMEKVDTDSQPF